ncbi:MAG: hypothetical protein HYV33_02895 [Candidatus Kerfeldbacteria bacterium]|nr:hypothetical protein [Candidatus Kerfeldbacteria bacterium]
MKKKPLDMEISIEITVAKDRESDVPETERSYVLLPSYPQRWWDVIRDGLNEEGCFNLQVTTFVPDIGEVVGIKVMPDNRSFEDNPMLCLRLEELDTLIEALGLAREQLWRHRQARE